MVEVAKIAVLILALLVAVGGVIGFVKAKSKASLIAGLVSGTLLGIAYFVSLSSPAAGLFAAAVLAVVVGGIFASRYRKTGKFMPSGLLLILCGVSMILSGVALLKLH